MKSAVVTGGAAFIGVHLVNRLHKDVLTVYGYGSQTRNFCYLPLPEEGISRTLKWLEN